MNYTVEDNLKEAARIEKEWDAGRPYPPPPAKTKIQMIADDLCAGNAWQGCASALREAAANLTSNQPDLLSIKRIMLRAATLLS